ncbi:MAG TPA: AMP-binding protein [Trebonia sp.]
MTDRPALLRPDDHADRAPDAAAVIVPATGRRISYRTMVDQSRRLANVLRSRGLRPGDLRAVAHSAAPCPVEVKRQIIEWFGPVISEYYSATEAAGHVSIRSEEWLAHPGSVGRVAHGEVAITDDAGHELPPGEDGVIWFTRPANKFSYHGDPDKSASMYNDKGWARMGDIGHLDADGYLFITGRSAAPGQPTTAPGEEDQRLL